MNSQLKAIIKIFISWFAVILLASCGGGKTDDHPQGTKLLGQSTKVLAQSISIVTPQSGWWWNPAEGGRGFTLEVQNGKMFIAGYLYDPSGRASWYAAGPTLMSGSTFASTLTSYSGGQTLTGAYHSVAATASSGDISIVFTDSAHGTMTWPGGVVPIERFNIVAGGVATTQPADTPEAGWWWSAAEGGRGYSIEIQNGTMFLAGYMYDNAGNPIWYASGPTAMTNTSTYQGTWQQYGNGQTLAGAYKSASVVNTNVGTVKVVFSDTRTATMTLPNGTIIPLTRYDFNGLKPLIPLGASVADCFVLTPGVKFLNTNGYKKVNALEDFEGTTASAQVEFRSDGSRFGAFFQTINDGVWHGLGWANYDRSSTLTEKHVHVGNQISLDVTPGQTIHVEVTDTKTTFPQNVINVTKITLDATFVGFEDLTLGGHTFRNTCKFSQAGNVLGQTDVSWRAPGFGFIKSVTQDANGAVVPQTTTELGTVISAP